MSTACPWPSRARRFSEVYDGLALYDAEIFQIPGVKVDAHRHCLSCQVIASERRFDFDRLLAQRAVNPKRADPTSPLFDPIRGAIHLFRKGELDEAFWLIFLSVHVGKHGHHGWRRVRDIYGAIEGPTWDWVRVATNPSAFRRWLDNHYTKIGGGFSNHRKYESLSGSSDAGTGAVVSSLVEWSGNQRSIANAFAERIREAGNEPGVIFDALYQDFTVHRFGRLGRFDLISLLGRIGFLPTRPQRPYLRGSTGPRAGAKLLLGGNMRIHDMEAKVINIGTILRIDMDVMEDALCNWQKSPAQFKHFTG